MNDKREFPLGSDQEGLSDSRDHLDPTAEQAGESLGNLPHEEERNEEEPVRFGNEPATMEEGHLAGKSDDPMAAAEEMLVTETPTNEAVEGRLAEPEAADENKDEQPQESKVTETPVLAEGVAQQSPDANAGNDEAHEEEDEAHEVEDYSHYSSTQLLNKLIEATHWDDFRKADSVIKELRAVHDDHQAHQKAEALKRFLAEGGEEDDFEFRADEATHKFEESYKLFREKKHKYFQLLEQQKEQNYTSKQKVLEKLRHLVDGEETTTSINALKRIQDEWKSVGQVPGKFAKTLWANYNALLDRFYDNRSIYFELKELDRKKNLESKLEICAKTEELLSEENIKEAVKELNILHDEFKHIGPVPAEAQEEVWQRFKSASDEIYSRRRVMVDELKVELKANMEVKQSLCAETELFISFNSEKINEWNKKTKEILELQKKWEAVGGVPKEQSKKVNKRFWSAFKTFFGNKSAFFKKLESMRHDNLKLKEALIERAEALQESDDFGAVAQQLKELQQEWKETGPVPEKVKEAVFQRFKAACDHFFERKRMSGQGEKSDYYQNLKAKEKICEQIKQLAADANHDPDIIKGFQEKFAEIGFVPRNAIKTIQKQYEEALDIFWKSTEEMDEGKRARLKMAIQVTKMKSEPRAEQKIHHEETRIKRQISTLENEISIWRNNLEFLASSRKADKLKADFDHKIAKAEDELHGLKTQLKVLYEAS